MLIHWLFSTLTIMVTAIIVPGATAEFMSALIAALVLGLLNVFIKPILVFFTLPITIGSLGLFTIIINALLLMLTSEIVPGFKLGGFWNAVVFALVLALVNIVFGYLTGI